MTPQCRRYASAACAALALASVTLQFPPQAGAHPCAPALESEFDPELGGSPTQGRGPDLVIRNLSIELLSQRRMDGAPPLLIWVQVENIGDQIAEPASVHFRYREYDSRAPYDGEWADVGRHALDSVGLAPGTFKQYPFIASLEYHASDDARYSQVFEAIVDHDGLVQERCGVGESNNAYTETISLTQPEAPMLWGRGG